MPELEFFERRNSMWTSTSPYFVLVKRLGARPLAPFTQIGPVPSLPARSFGFLGSSVTSVAWYQSPNFEPLNALSPSANRLTGSWAKLGTANRVRQRSGAANRMAGSERGWVRGSVRAPLL